MKNEWAYRKVEAAKWAGTRGNSMISLMAIMTISLAVVSGLLGDSASTAKAKAITDDRSDQFYEVEHAIGSVGAWLQSHSSDIIGAFVDANYATNFSEGAPSVGANDTGEFTLLTKLKMAGTSDSVLLTNDDSFGESAFPATTNIKTGAAFDAVSAFESTFSKESGATNVSVRATLVWAENANSNGYAPIFRVDALTGSNPNKGVHSYAYAVSQLITQTTPPVTATQYDNMGFFGRDVFAVKRSCWSYNWAISGGVWVQGTKASNCSVGSNAAFTREHNQALINGIARTNSSDNDAIPDGFVTGQTCAGAGCHNYALPAYPNWTVLCSGLPTVANAPASPSRGVCYTNATGVTLKALDSATAPSGDSRLDSYLFKNVNGSMTVANTTVLGASAITKTGIHPLVVYVDRFNSPSTDKITGNTVINNTLAPYQFDLRYVGSTAFSDQGNVTLRAMLTAPNVTVTLTGNSSIYGALRAAGIENQGSGEFYYDENIGPASSEVIISGGVPEVTGANFSLNKASLHYNQ
jgi:hypothetical protein